MKLCMKNIKKYCLVLSSLLFLLCAYISHLFAYELELINGYTCGRDMKEGTYIVGADFYFSEIENKSTKPSLKSVKQKIGCRISTFEAERVTSNVNKSEMKKIENTSIKFGLCEEFIKNEKILFNNKIFIGTGIYTRNENINTPENLISATNVIFPEMDISIGSTYFLTKKWSLSIDLGYRLSWNINKNRGNTEKFNSSGLMTTLGIGYKFS